MNVREAHTLLIDPECIRRIKQSLGMGVLIGYWVCLLSE